MTDLKPINKIIALWALTEAGLGGVFHAFKMPFTGLIISGLAVIYITLIARLSEGHYRQLVRATLIVLIVKMLISPHTPPTAYFAVLFQGFSAYVLFSLMRISKGSIYIFAMIALLESGYQKILTMTIFYGASVWDSINSFYAFLGSQVGLTQHYSGSQILLIFYTILYVIAAVVFASLAIGVLRIEPEKHAALLEEFRQYAHQASVPGSDRKKKWIGRRSWLILILFMIVAVLMLFNPEMGWQRALFVFLRALVVIVLWYTLFAPSAKYLFERFLKKQKKKYGLELKGILTLFPTLKSMVIFALEKNGKIRSLRQFRVFLDQVIFLTLHHERQYDGKDHPSDRT